MRGSLIFLLLAAGCVRPSSETCDDGRICPSGTVCGFDRCLTPAQSTACAELVDGDSCHADDRDGRCVRGACVPACGDAVVDQGEQCDDGNYVNHDGCTSTCVAETLAWEQWETTWRPRFWHAATYNTDTNHAVVMGGYDGAFLDDLWERSQLNAGSTWSRISAPSGPSPRQTTIAYDPERHVLVLFGGRQFDAYGDTWELDGTQWVHRTLSTAPSPRFFHGMVWDADRHKIVLFGGSNAAEVFDDTWEYDGTWTKLTTPTKPSARANFAMAYDPVRKVVVVCGGVGGGTDTWELAGSTWTQVTAGVQPAARTGAAMAFSSGDGKLVLFGGNSPTTMFADTWQYDGAWTQISPANHPEGTYLHTLTSVGDRLVLVGGQTALGATDQIWEYMPSPPRWVRTGSAVTPSNKTLSPAALDATGRMTVYGTDETVWTFDGTVWEAHPQVGIGMQPAARYGNGLSFDRARNRLVLFGGLKFDNTQLYGDTWLWDGSSWQDITTSASAAGGPLPTFGVTMAYDPGRDCTVMFGGSRSGVATSETWELDGSAWHAVTGSGPPAQQLPVLAYDPIDDRMVLLDTSGDTYSYAAGVWTKLSVPRLPTGVSNVSMAFDPWRRRMIAFGGFDATASLHEELWELADDGWHELVPTGARPTARYGAGFTANVASHSLVLFGGTDLGAFPGDTWLLKYRSETPDEICDDAQDNDGDDRIDQADPDCTLP